MQSNMCSSFSFLVLARIINVYHIIQVFRYETIIIFAFRLANSILVCCSIGLQDKIVLRKLNDNIGLIPIKLGNAKMLDYRFILIHYYDLNPIIMEINKLHLKAQNITNILTTHTEYLHDNAIHLQILGISQNRVENKIKEIVISRNELNED